MLWLLSDRIEASPWRMVLLSIVAEQQKKREEAVDDQSDNPADPQSLHSPVPHVAKVVAQCQR